MPSAPSATEHTTELTTWGHAGVRLERAGRRLVIDPGSFTDDRVLDGAAAVLVTHEHADHVVPERLATASAGDGGPHVWAPTGVAEALVAAGAPAARVHPAAPGDAFEAAGFAVRVVGSGQHAVIHPDLPFPVNNAYLIEGPAGGALLHPGDAFPTPPDDVQVGVLLLPVAGPWMKLAEAVDHVVAVAPDTVVPIHDAILTDAGRAMADRIVGGLVGTARYRRLEPGEALAV